ncbi:MAG: TPR repeat protein [Gammaproteobacteria bacterium]|jgi:TPR repeat protein
MVGLLWLCTCAWAAAQSPRGVYDPQALRVLAEQGDKRAAFLLASHYAAGRGVPRDDSEAVRWFTVAAEGGLAEAQYNLGIMYVTGRGVPLDRAKAAHWYERAAEQGLAEAQFNLGTLYGTGRGVRRDEVLAVKWLTRAAERGLARAQYNLGALYEHGRGVRVNVHTALEWYRKAAEHGLDEAKLRGAALAKKMQIKSKSPTVGQDSLATGSVTPKAKAVQSDAKGTSSALVSPTRTTPNLPDLDWVREAPAEHFTMQLASFASLAEAQRFARGLGAAVPLGTFETSSRGKPWFAVIRGVYASRAAATTAVGNLSEHLRKMKPWVRNLGQLRKQIR